MSNPFVKVRGFVGDSLEDACAKADDVQMGTTGAGKFEDSHVVRCSEGFKIVIITTQFRE